MTDCLIVVQCRANRVSLADLSFGVLSQRQYWRLTAPCWCPLSTVYSTGGHGSSTSYYATRHSSSETRENPEPTNSHFDMRAETTALVAVSFSRRRVASTNRSFFNHTEQFANKLIGWRSDVLKNSISILTIKTKDCIYVITPNSIKCYACLRVSTRCRSDCL